MQIYWISTRLAQELLVYYQQSVVYRGRAAETPSGGHTAPHYLHIISRTMTGFALSGHQWYGYSARKRWHFGNAVPPVDSIRRSGLFPHLPLFSSEIGQGWLWFTVLMPQPHHWQGYHVTSLHLETHFLFASTPSKQRLMSWTHAWAERWRTELWAQWSFR